jgi:hypothetical protein
LIFGVFGVVFVSPFGLIVIFHPCILSPPGCAPPFFFFFSYPIIAFAYWPSSSKIVASFSLGSGAVMIFSLEFSGSYYIQTELRFFVSFVEIFSYI